MFKLLLLKIILIERALAQFPRQGGGPLPTPPVGGGPLPTQPVGGGPISTGLPNPLGVKTIEDLLERIVGYLFKIAIPLAAIMIIWGAFQILFAGGNPEKVATGRRTVVYATVGLLIVFLASSISIIVKELLGAKF